ncbi:putative 2-aminoethylphosphonate ABC transporter ATP-binding protein [Stappia sp. 28M-7]|uniref:putative 2-aminoethylphosphonate ABC transporter ATP-binding protein n=1 Tax=Stappia sp. 28M-7 TaxID=2762596 RepID=UPI00163CE4ED|nr:putative 2-aminoethylphosphonate ABC transporter ATP-binding protein [Stappia sp. 28M-7]MBC2860876.1 putative 2-aminoethylphosphonate ABC transporter ATP-binding protein [Stappia sp. 28M-7]
MDLSIHDLVKRFGKLTALDHVSLEVAQGSFVCFLGPSGCGKTTLLRVIAGLEEADGGSIRLGGSDLSAIPARNRNFGVVFQSYSLFPNMTAARNVGYGLECRGWDKARMQARIREMLDLVHLADQAEKLPSQMSGGQQQRIALARALAPDPSALLLDEPLSALDAKVREELRIEIRAVQKRLGITTIMVTHDQEEALAMADLIVVMSKGHIEQIGTPQQLYREPATAFVADFIGRMNVLPLDPGTAGGFSFGGVPLEVATHANGGKGPATPAALGIRPEAVALTDVGTSGANILPASVRSVSFLGNITRVELEPENRPETGIVAELHGTAAIPEAGARLAVSLPADALRVLS